MSNDPTKATGRWDIGKSNLLIQLSVLTAGPDSKSSIRPSFSFSSAMVLTAYTCMVVGQKAIEAWMNIPDGALLALVFVGIITVFLLLRKK